MSSEDNGPGGAPQQPNVNNAQRRRHRNRSSAASIGSGADFAAVTGQKSEDILAKERAAEAKMAAIVEEGLGAEVAQTLGKAVIPKSSLSQGPGSFSDAARHWKRGKDGGKGGPERPQ